uniref:Uncharacterized protein n=1 Tax=Siphoviridae sp. ctekV29 TaxID=2826406 RepID=A0A8S5QLS8_9CAUD|nr:MAG TPA: hypothetical protein [Siphoviridae sp. ctekV29]
MNELFLLCIAGIYTGPDVMLNSRQLDALQHDMPTSRRAL